MWTTRWTMCPLLSYSFSVVSYSAFHSFKLLFETKQQSFLSTCSSLLLDPHRKSCVLLGQNNTAHSSFELSPPFSEQQYALLNAKHYLLGAERHFSSSLTHAGQFGCSRNTSCFHLPKKYCQWQARTCIRLPIRWLRQTVCWQQVQLRIRLAWHAWWNWVQIALIVQFYTNPDRGQKPEQWQMDRHHQTNNRRRGQVCIRVCFANPAIPSPPVPPFSIYKKIKIKKLLSNQ